MTETTALIKLQEIDIQLLKDASALAAMPQQAKLKTIALARKKVESEITKIVGQRKDAQIAIEDLNESLEKYHEVQERVQAEALEGNKTHREVRDLDLSLSTLAKRIEKANFEMGPAKERLEKLQLAEKNAKLTLERLDAERDSQTAAFNEGSSQLKAHVIELKGQRDTVAAEVAPEHLASYETARKRFGGLAVETLIGNVPSICRVKLQPSLFHDLSHGPEITECPYCHRMLITSNEVEE